MSQQNQLEALIYDQDGNLVATVPVTKLENGDFRYEVDTGALPEGPFRVHYKNRE